MVTASRHFSLLNNVYEKNESQMRTSTVVRTSPRIFFLQYPDACDQASTIKHPEVTIFEITASLSLPWVPEVFLACGGNFPCWPKAEATSGEAARKTFRFSRGVTIKT